MLLEGATESDFANDLLHLRGALPRNNGVEYNPATFLTVKEDDPSTKTLEGRAVQPLLWFRSVLQQTVRAEPVLHCYGLHEWAMQYQPDHSAPPPPAAQYQAHLPLRVSRTVINAAVERKGVHCTHVDALRFFAPAALPLNHHNDSSSNDGRTSLPTEYSRQDQLRWEQPACVHANMDLFKYALRLRPHVDASLVRRALALALQARQLDVAASPYDCERQYGIRPVPVETAAGRADYRQQQVALLREAEPVRRDLLRAYNEFLDMVA